jgi:hypothetical protein
VLGLFENPFVDAEAADRIVGSAAFRAAGDAAQRASITVLQSSPALPFARGVRLYVEGIAAGVAAGYGEVVATPEEADLAVLRLEAPYEERDRCSRTSSTPVLAFPAETIAHVREVAAAVPTVVDVFSTVRPSSRPSRRVPCRSMSRARWRPSRHPAPTCRSTRRTRCSASGTASRSEQTPTHRDTQCHDGWVSVSYNQPCTRVCTGLSLMCNPFAGRL